MNATITTLDIVMGDKTVPLSKSIVNQIEWLNGTMGDKVTPLGTVSTTDGVLTIFSTPRGLQKNSGDLSLQSKYKDLPRIILTK